MLLAVTLVLDGDIVLTGSLTDGIVNVHPGRARYSVNRKDRVAALDTRLGGNRPLVNLTDHVGIHRHGDTRNRVDAHKQQKARQDIDENAREQHKGALEKALAKIGVRTLLCKELGLAARQLPHIALGSRMLSIETAAVKGGVTRRISWQRLILGGIVARRGLLPFLIPRRDRAPTQEQGACLEHILLGKLELDSKVGHGHATMTVDSREHAIGARDIGRIHTADGSVATQQQRGHAKLGSNATRRVMDVKAARQAQKELGHTDAAGTRRQKVAALVQKHEDGKHQQAPKDR